jgi:hypothetical protein
MEFQDAHASTGESGSHQRVLVVGTDDWAADRAAASVEQAGLDVLRCHESGQPTFPCNAFNPGRTCPLDAGFDVVLTVRARPSREPEPGEVGVVCALRTGRPLVVAGVTMGNPFSKVATAVVAEGGDAAQACRIAAESRAADPSIEREEVIDLDPVRN